MELKGPKAELSFGAQGYPEAFCGLEQPPGRLYVIGEIDALQEGLAVIGARNATPYGKAAAKMFASAAAGRGIPVISGGARGCDAEAHRAAMGAGGITVAFLGGGCNKPYPKANIPLFQEIIDSGGAVVSEQPWEMPPRPYMFRLRNRLIAGLAKATLIVEAGLPSGTFSTADEALAANREVLVVPGSILSETSRGSNRLLLEGAVPVVDEESFQSQLSALFPSTAKGCMQLSLDGFEEGRVPVGSGASARRLAQAVLGTDERAILAMLQANPMRLEQIVRELASSGDCPAPDLGRMTGSVAKLEGLGLVERYPDGRFGPV